MSDDPVRKESLHGDSKDFTAIAMTDRGLIARELSGYTQSGRWELCLPEADRIIAALRDRGWHGPDDAIPVSALQVMEKAIAERDALQARLEALVEGVKRAQGYHQTTHIFAALDKSLNAAAIQATEGTG